MSKMFQPYLLPGEVIEKAFISGINEVVLTKNRLLLTVRGSNGAKDIGIISIYYSKISAIEASNISLSLLSYVQVLVCDRWFRFECNKGPAMELYLALMEKTQ